MIKALLKAPSHKEVGFLLVWVDVLGDPLRPKMNRRKQRDNPDRFSMKSVGVAFYFIVVDTLIPPMPSAVITNNSVSVFLGSSVQSDSLNQYEGISIPPSCHKHKA